MVVVRMGVEYSLDLVHVDADRGERLLDVGTRVDEVDPPLEA